MTRMKAVLAYDGRRYCGWQAQPNGVSVQSVVEAALAKIAKAPTAAVSSGRTDAGVHAYGQVFHFDSGLKMSGAQWQAALNGSLPDDIYVRSCSEADPSFHSRYDACWKEYDYLINMGEYDPLRKDYVLQYNRRLDVRAMREAAGFFVGTHDFAAFNANSPEERPNQVRTIYELTVRESRGILRLRFVGNGFLRYMVRMMTQTLIEVGRKKLKPERVRTLLDKAAKNSVPYNAPPEGLCLMEVGYAEYEPKVG